MAKRKKKKSLIRRIITWTFRLFLVLIAALLILPYVFKDQIVQFVKDTANDNLNAQVDFGDFDLALISTFPNFTLTVEDVSVTGVDTFAGIELAKIGELRLGFDLTSVLGGDSIAVNEIGLTDPNIHVLVLKDGTANYDIAKPSTAPEEAPEENEAAGEPMKFNTLLKHYFIKNAHVVYDDRMGGMKLDVVQLDHDGAGDFTLETFLLETETKIKSVTFDYGGVSYVNKAAIDFKADLDIDLGKMRFAFKENMARVNELQLHFDGFISMPSEDIEMDVAFETNENSFRSLLSMVPAVYAREFSSIETAGKLELNGGVKGTYNATSYPRFDVNLNVADAMFHYPGMPESVEDIQVDLKINMPQSQDLDRVVVDLSRFHMKMAQNPVDASFVLKHPMTDPDMKAEVKMLLDLEKLESVMPMVEGESYNGIIKSDLLLAGKASALEEERYDDFTAEGTLGIHHMLYASPDLDYDVAIDSLNFVFSPQQLNLEQSALKVGKSDIQVRGTIDNYLGYVLNDEVLEGAYNLTSSFMDLNELMGEDSLSTEVTEVAATDSTAEEYVYEVYQIPGNIEFSLNTKIKEVLYDDITLSDVHGQVDIYEHAAHLKDVEVTVLGGVVEMSGVYDTKDAKRPHVAMDYRIKNMGIKESAETFNTVNQLAPIANSCLGKFSSKMHFETDLDQYYSPVYNSINGFGDVKTAQVYVEGFEPLNKLAKELKVDRLAKQTINDVNMSFDIKDGAVWVKPFDVELMGSKSTISGSTSFESDLDYDVKMLVKRDQLGAQFDEVAQGLLAQANKATGANMSMGDEIPVDVKITGTVTDPKVALSFKDAKGNAVENIKEQVEEVVREKVEETIEEVKEDLKAKADEIMANARQQADKIREEGKKAAEAAQKSGYAQADQLVNEAGKNPLKKVAAEQAAKKLKEETDKKAKAIEDEANKRADAVMAEAQKQVDALN